MDRLLRSTLRSQRGFSLTELMVVVAIVGIISTIGAVVYSGFKARARQKQGLNLMNAYYAAAQSVRAEYGHYPGNFVHTGFQPTGQLYYRLRAAHNRDIPVTETALGISDPVCWRTQAACDCSGTCTGFKTWDERSPGIPGVNLGPHNASNACPDLPGSTRLTVTDNTFQIVVAGVVKLSATNPDRWTLNHTKQKAQCSNGLH